MWYEIPGIPGYRVNLRREVLSLKGEEPRILKRGSRVKLRINGQYVTYPVTELMQRAGIAGVLQVQTHHEAARDRCDQGHEFTPENTMRRKGRNGNPIRKCRECHRLAVARWRAGRGLGPIRH
jgi:hypothetical protein